MAIKFRQQEEPAKKSAAARKDAPNQKDIGQSALNANVAGTQALPADTFIRVLDAKPLKVEPKYTAMPEVEQGVQISRPEPKFNKTEYQNAYMKDLRTIKRLGLNLTVKQYRATKGE